MQDPNEATKELLKLVDASVQKSKQQKRKAKNCPRSSWISKEIIELCNKKQKLLKKLKKDELNIALKKEYQDFAKELDKIIKQVEYNYEYNEIQASSGNSMHLWEIIDNKLGKSKFKKVDIKYNTDEKTGKKITVTLGISNEMNYYFCNIGKELSDKIEIPSNKQLELPQMNLKTIFLHLTNKK